MRNSYEIVKRMRLFESDKTITENAFILDMSVSNLYVWVKKLGLTYKAEKKGRATWKSKLNAD